MKKISLVILLAMIMVLSAASMAFAAQGDSGYIDGPYPLNFNPHGGYGTATQKCAVCHAVHNAASTGEALLRSTRDDACTYCHITDNVSTMKPYPNALSYTTPSVYGHNSTNGVGCKDCHQVHGATSQMFAANVYLTTRILKNIDSATYSFSGINTITVDASSPKYYTAPSSDDSGTTAVSKWCSQCHPYYNAVTVVKGDGKTNGTSHVMTGAAVGPAGVGYVGSEFCNDCHDSDATSASLDVSGTVTSAFPHFTDGARFLTTGSGAAAVKGTDDGVCLKCHVDGLTAGVGITF